jgi:hypothetical protein
VLFEALVEHPSIQNSLVFISCERHSDSDILIYGLSIILYSIIPEHPLKPHSKMREQGTVPRNNRHPNRSQILRVRCMYPHPQIREEEPLNIARPEHSGRLFYVEEIVGVLI